ncbi:hypothetical protein [Methanobacterium sp. ACI-7]|uniref:hypothetical protein n=1 Tax=unclassified Methanobacterium TaxID=2627676 RepID=UPI0039C41E57
MVTINAITTDLINNYLIIGIALVAFLVLKEVFSADINKNKKIKSFITALNITIIPLFIIFMIIVVYKANMVLSNLSK